jgi:hypothetical protein
MCFTLSAIELSGSEICMMIAPKASGRRLKAEQRLNWEHCVYIAHILPPVCVSPVTHRWNNIVFEEAQRGFLACSHELL